MWRAIRAALLILLLALPLGIRHCFMPPPILDPTVVKVERAGHLFPSGMNVRYFTKAGKEYVVMNDRAYAPAWHIGIAGKGRWIDTVRRNELNSWVEASLCDNPKWKIYIDGPFVGGRPIEYGAKNWMKAPSSSTAVYDLYLEERGRLFMDTHPHRSRPFDNIRPYDLAKQRLTLCVRLGGGSMYGARAVSREVRVTVGRAS